jgi:hypothetical protein
MANLPTCDLYAGPLLSLSPISLTTRHGNPSTADRLIGYRATVAARSWTPTHPRGGSVATPVVRVGSGQLLVLTTDPVSGAIYQPQLSASWGHG